MILDNQLVFSSAQTLTATTSSTNTVDLGNAVHDIGTGESMYFVVRVTTTLADTDSDATCAVTLVTDDNDSFSSTTTAVTVGTFAAVSPAGTEMIYRLSPGAITERYLKVLYTVSGGPFSAGAVDAFLVKDVQKWTAKPNAAGASLPHEA